MNNKLKWSSIKRHAALPLAVIALLTMIFILSSVRGSKDGGTYEVKHWHGDASVLEEVTIRGEFVDYDHKTNFSWQGSDVNAHTTVLANANREWRYHYSSSFYRRIGDYYYQAIEPSFGQEYVVTRQQFHDSKVTGWESSKVEVPLQRQYNTEHSGSALYVNPMTYGLAVVGDDVFYTIVASRQFTGSNGIYRLSMLPEGSQVSSESKQNGELIVEYNMADVQSNVDQAEGSSIDVLGLEAVGNKLALITVKDEQLIVEGYSSTGEKLGSISVSPFLLANNVTDRDANDLHYYANYEAYVSAESEVLSLSFLGRDRTRKIINIRFAESPHIEAVTDIDADIDADINVEIRDEVKDETKDETKVAMKDTTDQTEGLVRYEEAKEHQYGSRLITYKEGKLYYASVYRQTNDDESRQRTFMMKPIHFIVSVYEHDQLLYRGELLTDINDDLIRLEHRNMIDYGFDPFDYRNIFDVYME